MLGRWQEVDLPWLIRRQTVAEDDNSTRVRIVVRPEPSDADRLSVADAMLQVVDAIRVLESAGRSQAEANGVIWRLDSATTNSPFTVVAIAEPQAGDIVNFTPRAVANKSIAEQALNSVLRGERLPEWMSRDDIQPIRNILERTLNGVADTVVDFYDDPPVAFTKKAALRSLEKIAAFDPTLFQEEMVARGVFGQLSGRLTGVRYHYGKPAITISNPQYGEVTCRVPQSAAEDFGSESKISDVWDGRFVDVSGRINYNKNGKPTFVEATRIEHREEVYVSLEEVRDPTFTGGLSVDEYLDHLREGNLG